MLPFGVIRGRSRGKWWPSSIPPVAAGSGSYAGLLGGCLTSQLCHTIGMRIDGCGCRLGSHMFELLWRDVRSADMPEVEIAYTHAFPTSRTCHLLAHHTAVGVLSLSVCHQLVLFFPYTFPQWCRQTSHSPGTAVGSGRSTAQLLDEPHRHSPR